ncbi:hypothetical protein [Spirulina sp. 06S082]|uniref:hypothetical protein n=1 Tax=Spirulina sp. 06S082 TaxID=3110248 RepID=UPI002B212044|nr:hypothetical protein [Spirulina sp. 06S082]MEA5472194.1 hypothetical protein [Spirulina sp. 06S082]
MRLKRWESPRRQGRNHKGKGGSARHRQLKKQQQMMRKKLKGEPIQSQKQSQKQGQKDPRKDTQNNHKTQQEGRDAYSLPSSFLSIF